MTTDSKVKTKHVIWEIRTGDAPVPLCWAECDDDDLTPWTKDVNCVECLQHLLEQAQTKLSRIKRILGCEG